MPTSPSPNDPRYARWETNMGIGQVKEGHNSVEQSCDTLDVKGRIEAFTTWSHTNTIVITAEIESGFVTKDDLAPFRCSPVSSCADTTLNGGVDGLASRAAHRNGRRDPQCPSARRFRIIRGRHRGLLKVVALSVPGWWPMKQLVVRLRAFLTMWRALSTTDLSKAS
ncbi:hypothetical protein TNCV_361011 [Trichonephila clavipes]|nr:hypothetical protein TNCV_361011 [Trichonephila clavipes]